MTSIIQTKASQMFFATNSEGFSTLWNLKSLFGLLVLYTLYYLSTCLYNVFFHPLSRYPGPKLWAATYLTYWFYALRGEANAHIRSLHEKYGDVIRIAPSRLSFTCPEAWTDIYGFGSSHKHPTLKKDPVFYAVFRQKGVPSGINNAEDAYHARLRKQLSYAFSDKALKEQEPLIKAHIDLLIKKLRDIATSGDKLDMVRWFNFTTFDVNGDLSFGESFYCLGNSEYHIWIQTIWNFISAAAFLQFSCAYPMIRYILIAFTPKRVMNARKEHGAFVVETVQQRLKKEGTAEGGKPDFISYLLKHKEDQDALTPQEITINASMLVIAGSETTATLMSGAVFWLSSTPAALKKVTEEVRSAFSTEDEINFSNATSVRVPYLAACIEEALRMYPPAPTGLPRVVDSPIMVAGYPVPKDTIVSVHQLSTFSSPRNFHLPNEFHPERWLPVSSSTSSLLQPAEFSNDKSSALQPFSLGLRNCIGKNLAYNEIRVILARLLWNFNLSLCEESREWHVQKSFNLWVKKPLWVKLELADGEREG